MYYNGAEGKKKADLTTSVNATAIEEPDRRVAPVMITLKDGSQGLRWKIRRFSVFIERKIFWNEDCNRSTSSSKC